MKPNLSHKIGLVASHASPKAIEKWIGYGCRHFAIGMEWAVFNPKPDEYHFHVADEAINIIRKAGGTALILSYLTPVRFKPEYPTILNHPQAIPIMHDEWVIEWVDYNRKLLDWATQFGDTIQVMGPIRETNLPGWWEKERTPEEIAAGVQKQEGDPEQFIRQIIRPVSALVRFDGKKVIAGTVTLQGERSWTYNRALKFFKHYQTRNFGSIDHMDFHVYRDSGKDTVNDIKRFIKDAEIKNVWISELGFNQKGGLGWWGEFKVFLGIKKITDEERQEVKYKDLFRFLESTKIEDIEVNQKIKRIYLYRAHDTENGGGNDGLMTPDFKLKKAGELVRQYLQP